MKKIFVFDFDGTLIDSNSIKYDTWFKILPSQYHKEVSLLLKDPSNDRYSISSRIEQLSNNTIHNLTEQYTKVLYKTMIQKEWFVNCEETLNKLSSNCPLYISSLTPEVELNTLIINSNKKKYFKKVFGRPSSKVEHLKKIMDIESCSITKIYFIGDSLEDLKVSKDTGCHFIGIHNNELKSQALFFNNWYKLGDFINKVVSG